LCYNTTVEGCDNDKKEVNQNERRNSS